MVNSNVYWPTASLISALTVLAMSGGTVTGPSVICSTLNTGLPALTTAPSVMMPSTVLPAPHCTAPKMVILPFWKHVIGLLIGIVSVGCWALYCSRYCPSSELASSLVALIVIVFPLMPACDAIRWINWLAACDEIVTLHGCTVAAVGELHPASASPSASNTTAFCK